MSVDQSDRYREMLAQRLSSLAPFPEDRFEGRGIVLCGGGNYYFPCVWICIRTLRAVGCTLPIELWYRGPHEMTDEMKSLVEPYGVVCRDAFAVAKEFPVYRLDGWELKPYAIMNSRFAEVLYIDADNVVVRDPEFLFDSSLYKETGALFWQDVPNHNSEQSFMKEISWEMLDLPFRQGPEFESGQMVIDKRRCWSPMQLTLHLNEHSDYYYTAFFGDKDTFRLSWIKVGQEYGIVPHPPDVLGPHFVLVQSDAEGKRLFQHRCNSKWTLAERNIRVPGFIFEEECLGLLEELRARWQPESEELPLTPAEHEAFGEIVATQTFRIYRDGQETGHCVFESNLTLHWSGQPFDWRLEEDKDGNAVLIFTYGGRRMCFLRKTSEGTWSGHWRYADRSLLELRK